MNISRIRKLLELVREFELTELEVEEEGIKLKLRRDESKDGITMSPPISPLAPTAVQRGKNQEMADSAKTPAKPLSLAKQIKSPMVGTFYVAPEPGASPFVKIGDKVVPDTVVCIIEAMKVMNEIKAETQGTLSAALVENGQPVEYGQPLFEIIPQS